MTLELTKEEFYSLLSLHVLIKTAAFTLTQQKNLQFYLTALCVCLGLLLSTRLNAQNQRSLSGKIIHQFNKEAVAYASIHWKEQGNGCVSDSVGNFTLAVSPRPSDSLIISFVGLKEIRLPKEVVLANQSNLVISMETELAQEGPVVKSKFNKGLRWWKNVVANKAANSPRHYPSYYCQLYNKIEVDIANLAEQISKRKLLKPFAFVLENMDSTSESKAFLPAFLTETISDYYTATNPSATREEIKAVQTSGIKNESIMEYLGGINQKLNAYDDYMTIFGKEFISPVSSVGDKYYNYKGADTQTIRGEKYFHLRFSPKQEGENVFAGDCWIHSTTWALQKISMEIASNVNINFVHRLSIVQEFGQLDGKEWVVIKDKFDAELSPFGKDKLSFIGRKTSIYRDIKINEPFIKTALAKNKKKEEAIIMPGATEQQQPYWVTNRAEPLSVNETRAATLFDTIRTMPAFKRLSNTITFVVDGHKRFGPIEIGPWYKWTSANQLEGRRFRFDLGTTESFNKNLRLFGYLAYGTKDGLWKGKAGLTYRMPGNSDWSFTPSYAHDIDNGRAHFNGEDGSTDNMFSNLLRRSGIKQKFIRKDEYKIAIGKDFHNNLSMQLTASRANFETYAPLPPRHLFSLRSNGADDVTNTEVGIKMRYAPGERVIQTHRKQRNIRSNLPVAEISFATSLPNVLGGEYRYQKIGINISERFRIPRWGQITYMAYAGKIFGDNIPFMLTEIHPGNEVYYYDKDAFNLMNRYEYFSDKYAGINLEHNFEKKLLNLIPFMRKTKIRQFWNIKTVWGNMSRQNRLFNMIEYGTYHMRSLQDNAYTEIGTGFDNIFSFFRIDAVWRISPPSAIPSQQTHNFGVFGSFRLQF
ncbi:MAG: carboxypeptidase-like regulatory domain-containing protein [Filimonas sp.]|nr:carboxypeptidase-like regulatory domain-containing protein [Filimonas sp.]